MSLLLPHLTQRGTTASSGSGSVTTALIQRAKILQEENDELYELLKTGETGRLKEDVRALRRVVQKLEGALRGVLWARTLCSKDIHSYGDCRVAPGHRIVVVRPWLAVLSVRAAPLTLTMCSAELEKSEDALLQSHGRQPHLGHQPSPAPRGHQLPSHLSNGIGKLPPTGPRAHKKPRLSESQMSPPALTAPLPPKPHLSAANATQPRGRSRDSRASVDLKPSEGGGGMDVDDDSRSGPRSPLRERDRPPHRDRDRGRDRDPRERERDRDRPRNRDRERDRERDRDRDHDRSSRRHGGGGGGGGGRRGGGRRTNGNNNNIDSFANGGDRTLAERMGL